MDELKNFGEWIGRIFQGMMKMHELFGWKWHEKGMEKGWGTGKMERSKFAGHHMSWWVSELKSEWEEENKKDAD